MELLYNRVINNIRKFGGLLSSEQKYVADIGNKNVSLSI